MEGTEPVERPEMDKMVTPTPTLTPRAPGEPMSQRQFGAEFDPLSTIKTYDQIILCCGVSCALLDV